ncbi:23S rRNA (uracil(1939)-C(5))-methyltransferase RlmD [Anaerotignum propionicum]|uniref:23S rRNA (Uracil-C(5))-methyltransferase RlmCD n=1 Tax=Anaerotignum propionicum DSM 1682 TaxID=991789 RepID=A0A120MKA0_ANAPI|nr:23S rRNA (uracil(1939)-C(5))-methyltransferase RlmD [Anaerotignum propionicum]AMJ41586.1 23S rRNA (uracil-C(5))-methyltransferase RlmCD [Anaerotignum propionicum DSM 1682]SHE86648.1 23S rRNA m(5)U-1939 methyltransferase [[Clostridium] propionicum DSM 1682] [Anaerotignum propionicum DSM 1682]
MSLPVEKNEIYEMTIDALGSNGEGIGRIDGFTIFVEGALPEERIKVLILKIKKSYGYGKLVEILLESPYRVEPSCPVAKTCGGCQLQHLSYEGQLEYKAKKVKDDLERIGGLKDIGDVPILGMENPWRYRNKAQFPVGMRKTGATEIGFYAKRSHRIVDSSVCFLQDIVNDEIISVVREFMDEFKISAYDEEKHKGLVRHILTRVGKNSGEIMICIVLNGKKLPYSEVLVERLRKIDGVVSIVINVNKQQTNVILGEKVITLWGKSSIEDTLGDISFEISPLSFYQVNPTQTEVLYNKAVEMANLNGEETVLDLYCGIGTISLFFAKKAKKVFGVEIVPEAIVDARKNAERNGIQNVSFEVGAAEVIIPKLFHEKGITADVIVVDPPRKGCDEILLNTIASIKPKKLIYVSCNPATLARDVSILTEKGFKVEDVQAVDQFPMTTHVEAIIMMTYCGDKTKKED